MKKNMLCFLICGSIVLSVPAVGFANTTNAVSNEKATVTVEENKNETVKSLDKRVKALKEKKSLSCSVFLPSLEGFKAADIINAQIKKDSDSKLEDVVKAGEELLSLDLKSNVAYYTRYNVYESEKIVSVPVIYSNYMGGAHGNDNTLVYTALKDSDKLLSFKDLFQDGKDYKTLIKNIIIEEMKKNPEIYYENPNDGILNTENDFKYFLKKDAVVVYYDPYEVAPFAGGTRYFTISAETLKDYLKSEIYNEIKNIKESPKVSLNGKTIDIEIKFEDGLVAFRDTAELLGYKVGWSKETGITVNEKPFDTSLYKTKTVNDRLYIEPYSFNDEERNIASITFDGNLLLFK